VLLIVRVVDGGAEAALGVVLADRKSPYPRSNPSA
jgi:hypothetical protein